MTDQVPSDLSLEARAKRREMYGSECRGKTLSGSSGFAFHDWRRVDTISHSGNDRLGTYCYTDYYKCERCGEWAENFVNHNYSGD